MFLLCSPAPQAATTVQQGGLPCPGEYLRPPPPYNLSAVRRQRNMTQMKEQSKASERELSEEIVNLSDGDFEALAIKMLTDLIELS